MDGVEYLSVDLESPLAMRNMDVTRLDLSDASFDIILCSHVLEHVPDDRAAMRELLRVLADDGFAMLQTPWDPGQAATDEDPTLLDPAERVRRFGQEDHVRAYGRDLLERLRKCGWDVELVNPTPTLDAGSIQRYGLSPDDPLLIGRRAR